MIAVWVDTPALGDTIASIPTCKKISESYGEAIHLITNHPYLFEHGHSWVAHVSKPDSTNLNHFHKVHRLFMPLVGKGYELQGGEKIEWRYSNMDIRQFHAVSQGFMLMPDEMETDLYIERKREVGFEDYVIIHPTETWATRTWSRENWQELCDRLYMAGIPVVAVGRSGKESGFYSVDKPVMNVDIKLGINLLDDPDNDVAELRWMMNHRARCVVTMDSGILHVAGTTDVNIIQLGSSIDWRLRAPYRKGSQDYKYQYVGGSCNLSCSSNMKYNARVHGNINGVPPQIYCLENKPTFECHPNVKQVFEVIKSLYKHNEINYNVDPKRICVTTIYDEGYSEMASITAFNNFEKYCKIHGYTLKIIKLEDKVERTPHWEKIRVVSDLLHTDEYDYVFFIDLDCLFMNTTIKLESLISEDHFLTISGHNDIPDTPIINSHGTKSIMTAQFLIKNCEKAKYFLKDVWAAEETIDKMYVFDYEMRQFRVSADKPEYKDGIKIIDSKYLNTFWYTNSVFMLHHFPEMNDNVWRFGDFIVHVPGGAGAQRIPHLSDLNYFMGGDLVGHKFIYDSNGFGIQFEPLRDMKDFTVVLVDGDGNRTNFFFDELKVRVVGLLYFNENLKKPYRVECYNKQNELISVQVL